MIEIYCNFNKNLLYESLFRTQGNTSPCPPPLHPPLSVLGMRDVGGHCSFVFWCLEGSSGVWGPLCSWGVGHSCVGSF